MLKVEKAEALLLKIRDNLKINEPVKESVEEFYNTLPHNEEDASTESITLAWLSRKQDLCQVGLRVCFYTREMFNLWCFGTLYIQLCDQG